MIDDIQKISNIGSFRKQSEKVKLAKGNLFYGYNGSGKTTLSRIFECIGRGQMQYVDNENNVLYDFSKGELCYKAGGKRKVFRSVVDGPLIDKIKVFNTDFIENNLSLKKSRANKVDIIIGDQNIKITDKLNKINTDIETLVVGGGTKLKSNIELQKLEQQKNDFLSNVAKEIRICLHIDNPQKYTQKQLKVDLERVQREKAERISEEEKNHARDIFIEPIKTKIELHIVNKLRNFDADFNIDAYKSIIDILQTSLSRNSNPGTENIKQWLESGLTLHRGNHSNCLFCGQKIADDFWQQRYQEIKDLVKKDVDFEMQEKAFWTLIDVLRENRKLIEQVEISLPDASKLSRDGAYDRYIAEKNQINNILTELKPLLEKLDESAAKKALNLENVYSIPYENQIYDNLQCLIKSIRTIEIIIQQHNAIIDSLESRKAKYKQQVVQFYIQKNSQTLNIIDEKIKQKTKDMDADKQRLGDLEKQKLDCKRKLAEKSKIIMLINKALEQSALNNISFREDPKENVYTIQRKLDDGTFVDAKNLSEGEKTLIAFLYFIIPIQSMKKSESPIIVIDDPISSLDSKNLFQIGDWIAATIRKCEQVILLTHNFYFFVKIREVMKHFYKSDFKIFEIQKMSLAGSKIRIASVYLKNSTSEYLDLVQKLNEFYQNKQTAPDVCIGNLIRRVLETYLDAKIPNTNSYLDKINCLTKNYNNRSHYLWGMANAFSHSNGVGAIAGCRDFSYVAGRDEIADLFHFIKTTDKTHFKALGIKI